MEQRLAAMKERMENDLLTGSLMLLTIHLGHFNYAMGKMRGYPGLNRAIGEPLGFYTDAVLRRIGDWFAEPPGVADSMIDHALITAGLSVDDVREIDEVLDRRIGKTTWRRLIKDYRNGAISHDVFTAALESHRTGRMVDIP